MYPYRQFRKKLALTAKKLVLKLVEIVYNTAIQLFTPPTHHPKKTRNQTKNILLSAVLYSKTASMVRLSEKTLPCN
jgi:hypothetical protein